jgi:small subunit ribosomal protein S20
MAQHKSAEKRARRTVRRTKLNIARKSRVRHAIREIETAIAGGNAAAARDVFKKAQPEVQSGARQGAMPKRAASRKLSRLAKRIKSLSK